jgi:hypothetical protein
MSEVEFYAVIEHIDDVSAEEIVKNNFRPGGSMRVYPSIEAAIAHEVKLPLEKDYFKKQLMKITGNVQLINLENEDAQG